MQFQTGMSTIYAGTLIDATGGEPRRNVALTIRDGRIAQITDRQGYVAPDGAEIIDLSDETLLPGIVDAHMHFFGVHSYQLHKLPTEREAYRALRAAGEARKMLLAGITAARDLGSSIGPDMRRAINEGHIPGPRMVAAGEFITTTGGTWEYVTLPIEWAKERDIFADGPDGVREMVRRRVRQGANVIKIGLSKGYIDDQYHAWGDDPLKQIAGMTLDEVKAAVSEAHIHNIKVSAHCIGEAAVVLALDGGVDIIEHGYGITEETRSRLAESQVLVGSTISQLYFHQAAYEPFHYPQWERVIFERHIKQMRIDFEKSLAAGVRYVLGTDLIGYPTHPQDQAAREFEFAVEWGMDPAVAIVSGMKHGAEALGLLDEIGTVEVGKHADLIATGADPIADITALQRLSFVMQGGSKVLRNGERFI